MGRKLKDPSPTLDLPDAVRSLFAADNPFRRKPSLEETQIRTTTFATAVRKRPPESDANLIYPNPSASLNIADSAPKKNKNKLEAEGGGGVGGRRNLERKRRKWARDELESADDKRKYGTPAPPVPAEPTVGEKRTAPDAAGHIAAAAVREEGKETFDDESKLLRTVFVGNLPLKTKRRVLARDFATFGEVESVRIRSVPLVDSKIPRKAAVFKGKINDSVDRVHAYIVFKDEHSAHASLSHNMALFGGNHIRVDMACSPRKKLKGEGPIYDRKRTVFVGNLPFDIKDEELYQLFCGSSGSEADIEAVRVIRDPNTSLGKGIAYVLFKTRGAANSIVRKRDLKIKDRVLRLSHAKSTDAVPKRRTNAGKKRDGPQQKITAAAGNISHESNERTKQKTSILSYQGVRSSKFGVLKKMGLNHRFSKEGKDRRMAEDRESSCKVKRPAVAARKAKQLLKKRNLAAATPESTHRNKKQRK